MKNQEQINQIEKLVERLYESLRLNEKILQREEELGMKKEAKESQEFVSKALSRWATANRILKYLKGEITENDLF